MKPAQEHGVPPHKTGRYRGDADAYRFRLARHRLALMTLMSKLTIRCDESTPPTAHR